MNVAERVCTSVHQCYWEQNLNCAITTLTILADLFAITLHPQVIQGAFGLNAGRFGSQCGLVQGSLFFMGIYGCHQGLEQPAVTTLCHKFITEFHHNFNNTLCKELRPQGFHPHNPPHLCENLTTLAIVFSARFIHKQFNPNCNNF